MTGAPSLLAELLAEFVARDIRLLASDDDGLAVDAPHDALTPELLDLLGAHKAELLAMLRPTPEAAHITQTETVSDKPTETVPGNRTDVVNITQNDVINITQTEAVHITHTETAPDNRTDVVPINQAETVHVKPADVVAINRADAAAMRQAALDRLQGDKLFPPDVMESLRAAEVRWGDSSATAPPVATNDAPWEAAEPVCRCGSTTWRDVPIHNGQSVRRDCDRCGQFLDFPVWYKQNALHYE